MKLEQCAAVDEKWFYFTIDGENVRLVTRNLVCLVIGSMNFVRKSSLEKFIVYISDNKNDYSHDKILSTIRQDLIRMNSHIPCYYYYKSGFDACDRFNRSLHDKSWPHKRGVKGPRGDFLNQYDFVMACILQPL